VDKIPKLKINIANIANVHTTLSIHVGNYIGDLMIKKERESSIYQVYA